HAIQIQRQEVRFHIVQQLWKTSEVAVPMMQVVYDSHIRDARLTQTLDDGNLVFRFAEPASVIVQAYRAALVSRRLSVDSGALVFSIVRGFSATHDPKLCFNLMPLQDLEDLPRFIVERRRKP